MIQVLARVFSWTVPVNVLLWMAPKDHAVQQVPRTWLPPKIATHVADMKCDGFTPTETVTLWHRLALINLEIRWDHDGVEDVILGILPVLENTAHHLFTSAAYNLGGDFSIIADNHPRLRKLCYPIAQRLNRIGLGF